MTGKPNGRSQIWKPGGGREDIKIYFQKAVLELAWNELAQDTQKWRVLVNMIMDFRVP